MTPERWRQVQHLFHEALDLPREERSAFLDEACAGDAELRAEVDSLLQADEASTPLLDAAPGTLAEAIAGTVPAQPPPGTVIGPYRLVRELARGGMGIVYLAERADGQFTKNVALKLVKRGMDSQEIVGRFRHERQILASLDHPHIARLYDGGLTDDGRPYLVMEYVDGTPIDVYCDTHQLSVEERLRLFEGVCEAVQYAHQKLVVHRDLKPSNIFVTDDGTVKLLDFGIAKLLSEAPEGISVPLTRTGIRVMTPEYAAPEQVRGQPITTATDVYALGVVLYELLTGHRPYETETRGLWEVERAVLEQEPDRPSTAVTKISQRLRDGAPETVAPGTVSAARATTIERLRRRLRGDLDTIVLKALRKEPERRYQSAQQLLEDIRRHLAGLPVQARRDSWPYRARKFVRRHATAVTAATLVLVALLGGLAAALWQARRAERERDVARQVSTFLEDLFQAPTPSLYQTERLDTLRVGEFLRLGAQKVRRELQGRPVLQSHMMHVLGSVFNDLALYDDARPLLEEALDLRRDVYGEQHPEVANTLEALGLLHQRQGDYATAESLHRQVLSMRIDLLDRQALDVGVSHSNLASALEGSGRFDEALQHYEEAVSIAHRHRENNPAFYAETANNLGQLLYIQNDFAAAEPLFRESIQTLRQQPNPVHPKLALSLNNLASLLHYSGKLDEAEPLYLEALAIFRDIYGDRHPEVSNVVQNLATLHDDLDHHRTADSLYRRAIHIDRQVFGDDHPNTGLTIRNLALLQLEVGADGEAERLLREAQAIFDATLPEGHLYRILTDVALGKALLRQGKLEEAEPLLRTGTTALAEQLPENHWLLGVARRDLGAFHLARGEYEQAESLLLNAYDILQSRGGDVVQETLGYLAALYEAWGRLQDAAVYRAQLENTGS